MFEVVIALFDFFCILKSNLNIVYSVLLKLELIMFFSFVTSNRHIGFLNKKLCFCNYSFSLKIHLLSLNERRCSKWVDQIKF